ncbi:MAG TPA: glutathione synthase [Steroidobacteraceae bacterium]|nr:glutathione synthase [Steroidobacteraceae bacterium]
MNNPTRLLVVMDPIDQIKYEKDTTLALLLAAQASGYRLHYAELADLRLRDGVAEARTRPLEVRADPKDWFSLGPPVVGAMGAFDVVLMRKDPPFDTEYIYATYILERAELAGALVVNRPGGLRDMNEKVYTAWFPQCCAPTLVTRDMDEMAAFAASHGTVVCKPLDGMGGRSIFVLPPGDKNQRVVFESLTGYGQRYAITQKYLPEIAVSGDARVLLIDGEPLPYALARIPAADDNRGNLAAGARGVARPLDERDRWLAAQIGPAMRQAGMLLVGLDVIGGFVTEINVTSPTGVRELKKQFGVDAAELLVQAIDRRLAARRA